MVSGMGMRRGGGAQSGAGCLNRIPAVSNCRENHAGPPCSMVVGADRSWHPSNLGCTLETILTQHSPGSRGQTAPALRCTPQMLPGARRRSAPSPVPLLKGKRSEGGTPKSSRARTAVETESDALCWTVNLPIATRNTSSLFPGGENPRCGDWWLDGRWLAWLWRQAA